MGKIKDEKRMTYGEDFLGTAVGIATPGKDDDNTCCMNMQTEVEI